MCCVHLYHVTHHASGTTLIESGTLHVFKTFTSSPLRINPSRYNLLFFSFVGSFNVVTTLAKIRLFNVITTMMSIIFPMIVRNSSCVLGGKQTWRRMQTNCSLSSPYTCSDWVIELSVRLKQIVITPFTDNHFSTLRTIVGSVANFRALITFYGSVGKRIPWGVRSILHGLIQCFSDMLDPHLCSSTCRLITDIGKLWIAQSD